MRGGNVPAINCLFTNTCFCRRYDFALPLLVLHAFEFQSATNLKHWLSVCPRRQITVLDTHDGMGIDDITGLANVRHAPAANAPSCIQSDNTAEARMLPAIERQGSGVVRLLRRWVGWCHVRKASPLPAAHARTP